MGSIEESSHLGVLVRALVITSKRLAGYPTGHPALAGALENAHRRLLEMMGPTGELVVAVSRDGLLFGDDKLESPQARSLATTLHQRGVATVAFERDMEPAELESFLRILGTSRASETGPLWEELAALGVRHIHLRPVDLSAIRLTDQLNRSSAATGRADELWDRLLRSLLAGEELSPESTGRRNAAAAPGSGIAELVERFLLEIGDRAPQPTPTDAATLSVRLGEAVGRRLETVRGVPRAIVVRQIAELIRRCRGSLPNACSRPPFVRSPRRRRRATCFSPSPRRAIPRRPFGHCEDSAPKA